MTKIDWLKLISAFADKKYDGHFTLMKFTTQWRCGFMTVSDENDIEHLYPGATAEEAIQNCLVAEAEKK